MAETTTVLTWCTPKGYRGFESHPVRQEYFLSADLGASEYAESKTPGYHPVFSWLLLLFLQQYLHSFAEERALRDQLNAGGIGGEIEDNVSGK
ncbi:MAG: hypothetical protein G01um101438_957 [Parcubacteria group bacterium Gr01-1014_38]|nr:MAG: hypothetical protein G01um101438_957 [Parcubacteria group bacterium Gr01-1014_38]